MQANVEAYEALHLEEEYEDTDHSGGRSRIRRHQLCEGSEQTLLEYTRSREQSSTLMIVNVPWNNFGAHSVNCIEFGYFGFMVNRNKDHLSVLAFERWSGFCRGCKRVARHAKKGDKK